MTHTLENNMFLTGWLPGVFAKTAAPIIIITTVSGLFAVVDAYFLGVYVGAEALSAVSLIFPALMLLIALQTLVSNGMASILARRLGAGNRDAAKSVFTGAHTLALAVVVAINLIYWLAGRQFIAVAAAGNVGVLDLAGILILQLHQAAFGAAIAEGFPFLAVHLRELLSPPEGQLALAIPGFGRGGLWRCHRRWRPGRNGRGNCRRDP